MGLLDLLKSQPKWKHPDAAVRISAVDEIPDADQDVLFAIAREDEDARVRRVASDRLVDPAALAEIARGDRDGEVRDRARDRLIEIARAEQDETSAADVVAAIQTLSDVPLLAPLAKEAPIERIARGAFDRLRDLAADSKVFAGIARQSPHAAIRTDALLLLRDERDVASVALRTEYKDTGLAAIERVADRDQLEAAAARAKNKVVSRRARAVLREQDQRAHQQAKSQAAEADARRQQALGLCRAAETLGNRASSVSESSEWTQLNEELRDLEGDWRALEALPEDEALAGRFQAAADAIRHAMADFERRRALEEQRSAERARALAARQALYERLQALPVPDVPTEADRLRPASASSASADEQGFRLRPEGFGGQGGSQGASADEGAATGEEPNLAAALAALSAAYEALGPARDPEAAAVTERFQAARERWLRELERRRTAQAVRPQLEQILQELDRLAA
ncbi:MAG: hypothetical protein HY654_11940, partial [Acidobacteria bacterium]|nr:hypothetical protein [Acidobacteriota bacterium]